jgi:hypothetical protein
MNAHLNNAPRAVATASSVRIGVLAVLLGALTPSAGPPLAAPIVGSCQPARVKFVSELNERSTSSLSFVNMPGTTINFIQGGASNSCVIVDFSADVATGSGTKMVVAATLDNVLGGANPNSRQFVADSQLFQSMRGVSSLPPSRQEPTRSGLNGVAKPGYWWLSWVAIPSSTTRHNRRWVTQQNDY